MSATKTADPVPPAARRIAPYVAEESGRGLQACLDEINTSIYECYGPDLETGPREGRIVVDSLFQYERLVRDLAAVDHLEFVTHRDLVRRPCPPDRILCAIRHDVDADIRAAVAEAEIERGHGAATTYYVLHTAPYYGGFAKGVFRRHGCMAILYREIQDLGHEVALHTDPLHLYQNLQIDGAAAVRTELAWLRSEGLVVTGTVAHNSAPVYGVENFAIFRGRNRRGLGPDAAGGSDELLTEIVHDGKWAPLGVLDEAELGLEYEGNDVFRLDDAPLEYGATRRVNRWRWNAHRDRLKRTPDPTEDPFVDQERLLADVAAMPPGRRLLLSVHPLYYGQRHARKSAPPRRSHRVRTTVSETLGWETCEPRTIQTCAGDTPDGGQELQAINFSDDAGMLDAPARVPDAPEAGTPFRVLVLGGRNLDGRTVPVPEHATCQAGARLQAAGDGPVRVRTLAFPGMGLCRHFAWLERVAAEERPDVVVVGVGADEIATSLPRWWSRTTGFHPAHPPGAYLDADDDGVRVVDASPGAAIRRGVARPLDDPPSLASPGADRDHGPDIERLGRCLARHADRVRELGATPVAFLGECGEAIGLWARDVPVSERRAGHARVREVVEGWARGAGIDLVDPYEAMLALPEHLPPHWSGTAEWNPTGHRVAAAALFRALEGRRPS
jgi:hypothetical protein